MYICLTYIQTYRHTLHFAHAFGVPLLSALAPESPFSVLSFPEELTRHSLLQGTEKPEVKHEELKSEMGYVFGIIAPDKIIK